MNREQMIKILKDTLETNNRDTRKIIEESLEELKKLRASVEEEIDKVDNNLFTLK